MAVVINEFEVIPEPARNENQATGTTKQGEKSNAPVQPPTDHEVKRMLERRLERTERVSAH